MSYPKLDDIVKVNDVETKGGGRFAASYVNWARIARYLREHAPGWQPFCTPGEGGGIAQQAPDGSYYLLIGFENSEGRRAQVVPHAVMDHKMQAKKAPDARDISDAFVRGMCKAAALLFGLGWQLWSKDDPLSRDDDDDDGDPVRTEPAKVEGWDSRQHAEKALGICTEKSHLFRWAEKTRCSGFQGLDRDELLEAYKERLAIVEEGAEA